MKIHFITFGDQKYLHAVQRIKSQVENARIFDSITIYDENSLDIDFKKKYLIDPQKSRGFGYWIWKPYIIRKRLSEIETGDVLLYLDAGCHFNVKGLKMFNTFLNALEFLELPIIANQITSSNFSDLKYSKKQLLDYFKLDINDNRLLTGQFQAGQILIKKSQQTISFIEEWNNVYEYDIDLFSDNQKIRNHQEFVDHRHDQSSFSILCKLHNVYSYPEYLTYSPVMSKDEIIKSRNYSPFLTVRDQYSRQTVFQKSCNRLVHLFSRIIVTAKKNHFS